MHRRRHRACHHGNGNHQSASQMIGSPTRQRSPTSAATRRKAEAGERDGPQKIGANRRYDGARTRIPTTSPSKRSMPINQTTVRLDRIASSFKVRARHDRAGKLRTMRSRRITGQVDLTTVERPGLIDDLQRRIRPIFILRGGLPEASVEQSNTQRRDLIWQSKLDRLRCTRLQARVFDLRSCPPKRHGTLAGRIDQQFSKQDARPIGQIAGRRRQTWSGDRLDRYSAFVARLDNQQQMSIDKTRGDAMSHVVSCQFHVQQNAVRYRADNGAARRRSLATSPAGRRAAIGDWPASADPARCRRRPGRSWSSCRPVACGTSDTACRRSGRDFAAIRCTSCTREHQIRSPRGKRHNTDFGAAAAHNCPRRDPRHPTGPETVGPHGGVTIRCRNGRESGRPRSGSRPESCDRNHNAHLVVRHPLTVRMSATPKSSSDAEGAWHAVHTPAPSGYSASNPQPC